jgi:hypothetical protein
MEISFLFKKAPEESYSRQLDNMVASQEFPYGHDFDMGFGEIEENIHEVEREDAGQRFKKKRRPS